MTQKQHTEVLERLLSTMADDQGFPALSGTITEINKIVASESESASKLTKAILQDFALTNKLLRLVNTVSYGQFGGKINTISKAVVILGFETIRNVAMSLILLEFLQNRAQMTQLRDEVLASFLAGLVARQLSQGRNVRDTEEAMICAMFQKLGKLLAMYYFFDESQAIAKRVADGETEAQAAYHVLGISYDDLGTGVARHWNFPERLQLGMQRIAGEKIRKPRDELDMLSVTVNLANELCALAAHSGAEEKPEVITALRERYSHAIEISEQALNKALEHGLEEIHLRGAALNLPTANNDMIQAVTTWNTYQAEDEAVEEDDPLGGITALDEVAEQNTEAPRIDAESILSDGIQDVTNTLVADYQLNDLLQMVLETMYRGMGFHRIIAFVRDAKTDTMRARFGFGARIDQLLPHMAFPLKFEPDVFHVALEKGVDIVIEDVSADNIASKIPAWHHEAVKAKCFLLLPVVINGKAIGLIYADMQEANALQITPRQLGLLRTLRNQAVLAIRQKQ